MENKVLSTPNFETIQNICQLAHKESYFFGLVGYTGSGKTTAFEYYTNANENAYLIDLKPSMKAKDFYLKLLKIVGVQVSENERDLYKLIRTLVDELTSKYEKQLLIIDEAGKFQPKFLEYLHELRDDTKSNTGIIISGPEYFYRDLVAWKKREVRGVPEFFRRVLYWEFLEAISDEEIIKYCHAHKINDKKVIKKISEECDNFSEVDSQIFTIKQSRILRKSPI